MNYSPKTHQPLTFHDRPRHFLDGSDTPRAYLERCLEVIDTREPVVKAWVVLNVDEARKAADASTQRYQQGTPLSRIDGMPLGIKDMIETRDMPTQLGCPAFKDNYTDRDSASVWALRQAGAVILGKTVTTELAFLDPGPTTNPFDPLRTPGGSSSGSAAAVGAGMVPAALGTQLVASVLRPSGYCANWALKPTCGALHRGEGQEHSQNHIGIHAGSDIDMWHVAIEIARRTGGDPGHPGLYGQLDGAQPAKPARLGVLETEGWSRLDDGSRELFEQTLDTLRAQGIDIVRRSDSRELDELENAIASATELSLRISAWEQRWLLENLAEQHGEKIGKHLMSHIDKARAITLDDYRVDLQKRQHAQRCLAALGKSFDALVSLVSVGPAPLLKDALTSSFPTGDVSFSCPPSLLQAPATAVPALSIDNLPLGLLVLGQQHEDERVVGISRWLHHTLTRQS